MNYTFDDITWFTHFQRGENKAFDFIFRSYRKRIYTHSMAFLRDEMEAEEVTLDTFFALWKRRSTIESPDHILNWLYFDSRRRCISILRRPQLRKEAIREDEMGLADPAPGSNYERIHAELIASIQCEVEKLPEQMKNVFKLRFGKKLSPQQVADSMGIKVDTVYEYTNKALRRLRTQLFDQWFETSLFVVILMIIN